MQVGDPPRMAFHQALVIKVRIADKGVEIEIHEEAPIVSGPAMTHFPRP